MNDDLKKLKSRLLVAGTISREVEDLLIRIEKMTELDDVGGAAHEARRLEQRAEYLHDTSKDVVEASQQIAFAAGHEYHIDRRAGLDSDSPTDA